MVSRCVYFNETMGRKKREGWGGEWSMVVVAVVGFLEGKEVLRGKLRVIIEWGSSFFVLI